MARSLALDLARVAGAAWRDDGGRLCTRAFILGSQTAKRATNLVALADVLDALLDEVRPDLVSVEDDTGRGAGARTLRAYHAVAELCAARRGIAFRVDIGASRARSLALGHGGLSKEDAAKAAWKLLGIGAPTADEIDAAILLHATEIAVAEESYAAATKLLHRKHATKKRAAR